MTKKQGGSLSSLNNDLIAVYKRGIIKLSNKLEDLLLNEIDIREDIEELEETIKDYRESIKKLEEALNND
jgi:chromosome segregation ATPase